MRQARQTDQLREKILNLWLHACELDILTFKPGNVSVYAPGHDMTADHFRQSAKVSAEPITDFTLSLGEKIFYSIQATRDAVGCNTNLGIVLLCAPLIEAVQQAPDWSDHACLRAQLTRVLNVTTVKDALWVYQAIRLANPGGLGRVKQQDVAESPQVTLRQAMQLASHKDRVAYQYTTDYKDVFEFGVPCYRETFTRWGDNRWATLSVYTGLLSTIQDSLVERKHGDRVARIVTSRMVLVNRWLEDSSPEMSEELFGILSKVDTEFKVEGINPGTTADLTVASVFAEGLENLE